MSRYGRTVTLFGVLCILAGMTTLTAYAVPLYELFCKLTGYGGTTQVADGPAKSVLDRKITVRFNADTNSELPWKFEAVQNSVTVKVGEPVLAFYEAKSLAGYDVTGTATFNVVPNKAGKYFNKVDCFCFTEQTLKAGARVDLPVQFHIDPAIANDRGLDDVETITLSYTFFKSVESKGKSPKRSASTTKISHPGKSGTAVN
ncbi:MAG: cytochrome c oxidase assembly protein [Alphaproteobacteria bacterium]